jgi:glycosyltransferase involved in cell wall biosynthesis
MILKAWNPDNNEKGVIALHYTESLAKFASLYNLQKISKHYRIVLEPSWWGYQNVYFLFYLYLSTDIIIQCPDQDDYEFINKINNNFNATRIGAGDWVDEKLFCDGKNQNKLYDIVMVGNWSKIKRHEVLFDAISKNNEIRKFKIALIGYPSHGRTKNDIINEAEKYGIYNNITIYENINVDNVADVLRKSKLNVLLSKGEGANRGIYEGMFSGNVIVLYNRNRGVNKLNINEETGVLSSEQELPDILYKCVKGYNKYNTADWANNNIGAINSSKNMNEIIKNIAISKGEEWTTDIAYKMNKPNNLYYKNSDRIKLEFEYNNLINYLLEI